MADLFPRLNYLGKHGILGPALENGD